MPHSLQSEQAGQGHLAMLLFSALVAGSFSLGGQVANEIAPSALNAFRFVIAAAIMAAVVFTRGGVPREALRAPWRYLILGGQKEELFNSLGGSLRFYDKVRLFV